MLMRGGKQATRHGDRVVCPFVNQSADSGHAMNGKGSNRHLGQAKVLSAMGALIVDSSGGITFCNPIMLEIFSKAVERALSYQEVINQPLASVLGVAFGKTLVGSSLLFRKELNGKRMRIGSWDVVGSTRLLWDRNREEPLGCIGYYLPYVPSFTYSSEATAVRHMTEQAAIERRYPLTAWITDISMEHALQLYECLVSNAHTVPNTKYCAFALQCAFNPIYGFLLLDRSSHQNEPDVIVSRAVTLLLRLIKAKDTDTFYHSLRVASITKVLGKGLGLSRQELMLLRYGAVLHDLGKLEIDGSLLQSTAILKANQMETLKLHSVYGARLLESYPSLRPFSIIVRYHHERFDGEGYPEGLEGDEIPFLSRILAVADSIDAMANPRPYRPTPLTTEQIIEVLEAESGHQFDPQVAKQAIYLIGQGELILDGRILAMGQGALQV